MNIKALLFIFSCTTLTVQAQQEDFGQDALINPSAATFNFDIASGPIEPTDESIAAHYQCPEWFRNAKFGIYMHWGVNSVPGHDGHYGRGMYWYQEPDSCLRKHPILGYRAHAPKVYQHHLKTTDTRPNSVIKTSYRCGKPISSMPTHWLPSIRK